MRNLSFYKFSNNKKINQSDFISLGIDTDWRIYYLPKASGTGFEYKVFKKETDIWNSDPLVLLIFDGDAIESGISSFKTIDNIFPRLQIFERIIVILRDLEKEMCQFPPQYKTEIRVPDSVLTPCLWLFEKFLFEAGLKPGGKLDINNKIYKQNDYVISQTRIREIEVVPGFKLKFNITTGEYLGKI